MFSISHELRSFATGGMYLGMSLHTLTDELLGIADRIDREHEACVSHLRHDRMPLVSVIPDEIILTVHPFRMGTDKEAAVKVLEETAEAYGIWDAISKQDYDPELLPFLADELADVIQAACNLADRYDIDLQAAMRRCEERNRERGRYE